MASSQKETKKLLRKTMTEKLRLLESSHIESSSKACVARVIGSSEYASASSIAVYLSMPKEIQTADLLQSAFSLKKKVFIPKIIGKNSEDLIMIPLESMEAIDGFPKNAWGIPEPELHLEADLSLPSPLPHIDLVIVPGVAFDSLCRRLGHGKGYYDCFLSRLMKQQSLSPPITMVLTAFFFIFLCRVPNECLEYLLGSVL